MITMGTFIPHTCNIDGCAVIRYLNPHEWTPSEIYRDLCEVFLEQQTIPIQAVRKWVRSDINFSKFFERF